MSIWVAVLLFFVILYPLARKLEKLDGKIEDLREEIEELRGELETITDPSDENEMEAPKMNTAIFYRGNQETRISLATIASDKGTDIDFLAKKFGTERVERMRSETDLAQKLDILAEDFNGYRLGDG